VTPGDRVAVRLSQSVEMAVAVLGTLMAGAVVVPISTMLGDDALRHRLTDSDARLLLCAGSELELSTATDLGTLVVTTDRVTGYLTLEDAIRDASAAVAPTSTSGDTPGILLYTSGTEGKSKGVLHGHRVIPGHYSLDFAFDHIRTDDVAYSPVDWAWGGGLLLGLLAPLAYGIPVVSHRQPGFDPDRALRLLAECGVSVGLFPPTVLRLLRQAVTAATTADLRLRCLVSGAESVEADLAPWAKEVLGATVNNAYGQTEANALVGHSSALGLLDPAALGRPYPGRRVAVLGPDLQPVAVGQQGQLAIDRTDPVCMLEYWRNPEATAAKYDGGWLLTGDTVHTDQRGQLFFHGRNDDIIKAAGYRIGPAEVEAALRRHPLVDDCAVVGVPDPVRGGAVAAFVRLRDDATDDGTLVAALQREVRTRVGAHAYPRHVHFVSELPRTATGKVNRAALRTGIDPPVPAAVSTQAGRPDA
jgi:acetyl-CoA synthetase